MPHTMQGAELQVGDEVIMRFVVKNVMTNEEYCNVTLESVEKLYPGNYPTTLGAVNTKQTEKIEMSMSSDGKRLAYEVIVGDGYGPLGKQGGQ